MAATDPTHHWLASARSIQRRRPRPAPSLEQLSAVYDIPVQLAAVLGKTTMPVSQLLRLGRGAVVELDRKVGEPVEIYVNNRLVARGEVLRRRRSSGHHHDRDREGRLSMTDAAATVGGPS